MADDLPFGWTEAYAIRHALEGMKQMRDVVTALTERVGELETEIARLDTVKANRAGRKPTAQGKQRETSET